MVNLQTIENVNGEYQYISKRLQTDQSADNRQRKPIGNKSSEKILPRDVPQLLQPLYENVYSKMDVFIYGISIVKRSRGIITIQKSNLKIRRCLTIAKQRHFFGDFMLFTKDRMRFFFVPNERESNDPLAARPFFLN